MNLHTFIVRAYICITRIFLSGVTINRKSKQFIVNFKIIKEKESKAAQEIKYLKNFSYWPTAKAKTKYSSKDKARLYLKSNLIDIQSLHRHSQKKTNNIKLKVCSVLRKNHEVVSPIFKKNV